MAEEAGRSRFHYGFYAAMKVSYDLLNAPVTYEQEKELGEDPVRLDFLIIKKNAEAVLSDPIGQFFRRVNICEYKSPENGLSIDEKRGRIRLGTRWYKYFKSRNIEGKIKTITIKRDAVGDIYIYLVCDFSEQEVVARTGKSVGYDFGLKKFLTASDGKDIESPLFFSKNSKLIKNKCKNLSHKTEKSHNRRRACLELDRAYKKTSNCRKDFLILRQH